MIEFFRGTVTREDWAAVGGILGSAVLLCVAFYFLIYSPQQKKLVTATEENQQVVADLRTARETQKNIEALDAETAEMQELVTQFARRLPEKSEIPTLLRQFEGFAREVGLRFRFSQLPPMTDELKATIPYTVVVWGNFHQVLSFINRLERFQRYLKVSDLNIEEQEEGVSEASFTLSTYRFIQPTSEEGDAS